MDKVARTWKPGRLFADLFRFGGTLFAGLSVAKLLHAALTSPLSGVLEIVFNYYRAISHVLFGWIPVVLSDPIYWVREHFNVQITLQEHWLDVFVLENLHWGVAIRLVTTAPALALNMFVGFILSLLAALACGLVDTQTPLGEFAVAAIAIVGMLGFTLFRAFYGAIFHTRRGESRLRQLRRNLGQKRSLFACAAIAAALAPAGRLLAPESKIEFGMCALLAYFFFVALYWLAQAYIWAHSLIAGEEGRLAKTFSSRNGNSMYAFYMLAAMATGLALVVANAGLSLLGL